MPDTPHLIIGTRGSDLALWQAHHVRDLIQAAGGTAEIKVLSTQGDREQVQAFEKLEGKGFFTKEIEEALLAGDIDVAVHSHKDLETRQPAGLVIAAVPSRASQRDVLLVHPSAHTVAPWLPLGQGATVGTSSVRRRDQLRLLRPDLNIQALRGNVPTRIGKLREGHYDAIVLAEAGVSRLELDLSDLHCHSLEPQRFVPAPAQGALALQMRSNDPRTSFIAGLAHAEAGLEVESERTVLRALDGGCQLPFGAHWDASIQRLRCFLQTELGPLRALAKTASHALDALHSAHSEQTLKVLITRTPRGDGPLKRVAPAQGWVVQEFPFIHAEPLPSPSIPIGAAEADWAWVGSPGAAHAAENWLLSHPSIRIATPGHGTADALPDRLQRRLGFIGSGHPLAAWQEFAGQRTEHEGVAIPHSMRTLSRWESQDIAGPLYAWPHYEPVPLPVKPPQADVVCFTSPSNVEAWSLAPPSRIIALGPSTSRALGQRNWDHVVCQTPDDFGILEAILMLA